MNGLSVRWSLVDCAPGVMDELASYVETTSHERFSGLEGLRFYEPDDTETTMRDRLAAAREARRRDA